MGKRKKSKKKKARHFHPAAQARRLARALLGTPPLEQVVPSKRGKKKKPKHKKREMEREWD